MKLHKLFFRGVISLCVLILASVSIHRGIARESIRYAQDGSHSRSQTGAVLALANGLTVLFAEDFEDGQVQGWGYDPARWSIITDDVTGSQVWTTVGAGAAFANSGEKDWGDYRLLLQARRLNSNANVYFRGAYGNGYALRLESGRVVLWTELGGSPQELGSANLAIGGNWHDYAIDALGTMITVTVDGGFAFSYSISAPASYLGGIGLEAYANDGARFDNLQVLDLSHPEPAPWVQTNGPAGGVMDTIEIHPSDPNILFAGGRGGVFKSSDAGVTWKMLPAFIAPDQRVTNLMINPANPQVMYALSGQLYKTTDGGLTWGALDGGRWFRCVTLDVANPLRLLAGDNSGQVFYSANGGDSWDSSVTSNLPALPISTLAFGGANEFWAGSKADLATHLGLLYHTTNGGASWTPVSLGQSPETEMYSVFVDPQNSAVVHVGLRDIYNRMFDPASAAYLFRTDNQGVSWSTLHLPATDSTADIIGKDLSGGWLFINSGANLFKSANGISGWTSITPSSFGGGYRDIAIHPTDGNRLYLPLPFRGGIYYSADGGVVWSKYTQGLLNTSVSLLALGNSTGSVLYAAAMFGEGTYKTNDYGMNWIEITGGGINHPYPDELHVLPTNPQKVWEVADVGKLFVSENGGSAWSMAWDPQNGYGFRAGTITAMAIAPSNSDIQYAVKSGFGIFKSDYGGSWWEFLHRSEVDYTYSLAVHPTNPDIVFSGYSPKPFQDWAMLRRSQDGGATWTTVLSVTHSTGITSVTIDPLYPDRVYAGSTGSSENGGGQIYRSLNGGNSWMPLNPHFNMFTVWGQPQLVGDPADPSTAYAASWLGGIWKTTNAGQSWTKLIDAPLSATSLNLDPADPNVIYASDRTAPKIWKSTDGGLNWFIAADFSAERAFLVNRVLVKSGAVYAATFGPGIHDGKLYRSMNGGMTWADITGSLPRSVLDIAVHPTNSEIIYVTTHIYGAYKTVNGGADWAEMVNYPDIGGYDIEIDPVTPNTVFTAGLGNTTVPDWVLPPAGYTFSDPPGVYRSQDGGSTWQLVLSNSNECRAVRFHPANHNLLFAVALSDGFFFSPNGGTSWYNQPLTGLDTYNLTAVWAAGDKIYVGTQGFGVYAGDVNSTTGAVTWVAARSNKPTPDVYNLQIQVDPADSSRIYVSANPGGLFRSDDGGDHWFDKNFLTPSVVVGDPFRQGYYNFAINPADSAEVWVGTWGKGVYKSYDGQDFNIGANGSNGFMFGKHINALLFHPTLGVLAASEEGIFRSGDGGVTWQDFSTGLATTQVRTLNRDADGTLYAGTAGYEMYYRQPTDSSWTQLRAFSNFGTFWPIWNDRPLYQYSTLLFHPTDPNTIYFGTFPSGIFKSLDAGASWREYNVGWLNDGVFSLVFSPDDTDVIYAGTYNGVSRSIDGGLHWERWDTGWSPEQWVFSLDFDPVNSSIMYACSKNGENEGVGRDDFHGTVMKSIDGGENWFPITTGLNLNQEFYKIIVDRFDPQIIYLATQWQGVYISYNGGAYWQPWNTGLTNQFAGVNGNNVTNTMALSGDGKTLYFGTAGSGVFRRMTIALNWHMYLPLVFRKP